jgi:asparagine synthase (glutamine-hydrolysing)
VSAASAWVANVSLERGLEDTPAELTASDDRYTVFFDGTLYEPEDLTRSLGLPSDVERPETDLVLAAVRRWGESTPEHLRGIFGLVVWDAAEKALYAVRDPVGIQPLFRCERGNSVLLSNSIGALTHGQRAPAAPSPIALAGLLANRMPEHDETFFTHVRRVPQGHVWRWDREHATLRRYWDPLPDDEHMKWASGDELERFDALLEQAVARALAFGSAGIFLSGGIDSVSVAAYAADLAKRGGRTPPAYSLVFPQEANEEDVQRTVAASLGLPHVVMSLSDATGPEGVLEAALSLATEWPSLPLNPWLPAYLRLGKKAAASGCRTILTGGGGDEWLTVTPYYGADLLRNLEFRRLGSFAANYRRSYPRSSWWVGKTVLWRFGLRPLLLDAARPLLERRARRLLRARLGRILPDWLVPDMRLRRELYDRPFEAELPTPHRSVYLREIRRGIEHPLVDAAMEEWFEYSSRVGAVVRMPYWDVDLLELLYRAHPEDLNRGGRSKGLVRDILERRFPDCGFKSQQKVIGTHLLHDLILHEAPRARKRVGPITALQELGIVDGPRFDAAADRTISARDRWRTQKVWDILLMETWVRARL